MVVPRLVEGAHELELEARAVRGEDGVAAREGTPEGPRDDRVDVLLRVLLLGPEREVERHPDLALVALVVLLQDLAGPLEHPRDLVEHAERRFPARGIEARRGVEGPAEREPALLREPGERVGLLESPDEPVVRQEHLVEQDLGRPVRHRAALLGPDRAREGGVEGLVVVPGLEGVRAPLGVEGVLLLEEPLRRLDVGPELLHRLEVARVVVVVEEVGVQDEPARGVAERLEMRAGLVRERRRRPVPPTRGFAGCASRCLGRVLPMWGSSGIWNPKLNEWFRPGIHSMRKLPPVPKRPPRLK